MKNQRLIFSALLLLGIAIYSFPSSAYVTTDIAEGAGRVVATVGDHVRAGIEKLEKLEHKVFGDRMGEGSKETDLYIGKIAGWATKYAEKRSKTGNPKYRAIKDNAELLAKTKLEIVELKAKGLLAQKEAELYYKTIDKVYQEKMAALNANKNALLSMANQQISKLNVTALVQQQIDSFKAAAMAKMEEQLGDEWAAAQEIINTAASGYETAKATVEKQYEKDQTKLEADLKDVTARRDALDAQIKELTADLEKEKELHQDTLAIEMKITAAKAERDQLNQQIEVEIPAKHDSLKTQATSDAKQLLEDYESAKAKATTSYANKKAELELALEDKVNEFMNTVIKKGDDEEGEENTEQKDITAGEVLGGSLVSNAFNGEVANVENALNASTSDLMQAKADFESSMKSKIRDFDAQIADKQDLLIRLEAELKKQLQIGALEALGVKIDQPDDALNAAMDKNYIAANKPETAENIDEIRRNRFIERRDAYLSSYADAVMIKNRIIPDLDILEDFAQNTDSMDTVAGVIGADTDIKIKTIEALMQYAEILVAQLRMDTATEFGKLLSYKVKNPDKEITNFNLDDYVYNCTVAQGE